jgi:hypothetical protein
MVSRISAWVELSFWQLAVRVLSTARPLSHRIAHTREIIERQPATRFMPHGWVIAGAGWLLGLAAGLWLAGVIF